jgi:hypothetical protein
MIFGILRWLRFGRIQARVVCIDGGVASEIEYTGRFGSVVGYWAYGAWCPWLPYKG